MKKRYIVASLILFNCSLNAQVLTIPDVNFKNALVNTNCSLVGGTYSDVDTNNNGEIELAEAAVVTSLSVNNSNISSLNGIAAFTAMNALYCTGNSLQTADFSANPNLDILDCKNNQLNSLILSNGIYYLNCSNNQLTTLDLLGHSYLGLDISYNQLSTIDIPYSPIFEDGLNISGNLYTSISILAGGIIENFICDDTMLNSLDLSHVANQYPYSKSIRNNLYLQEINLKNASSDFCFAVPGDEEGPGETCSVYNLLSNNPSLSFICGDDITRYDAATQTAYLEADYFKMLNGNPAVNTSTYCSFLPGGNFNTISGNVRFNLDGNSCNETSHNATNFPVKILQDFSVVGRSFTDLSGHYAVYASNSNVTLIPNIENTYFTISPPSYTSSFSGFGGTATADFCITPNGAHPDLTVSLIPITPARPGFDAVYKIVYQNKGTMAQSGAVNCNFSDDVFDFISAEPTALHTLNTLNWTFADLQPFESREVTFTLNLNSMSETPPVAIGHPLFFSVAVSPTLNDETYLDNYASLTQVVIGSYDPNDKQVSIYYTQIEPPFEYLNYIIRFQNTGTAAAENVVVSDNLDARFDKNSFAIVSASHPFNSRLIGNKFEVIFEGINLPDSTTNEAQSHGYVAFKVKPKFDSVNDGDYIENKANIYFDFNLPIVTNTVTTGYYTILTKAKVEEKEAFALYPNPAKGLLNVSIPAKTTVRSVRVFNILGQLVQTVANHSSATTISIDVSLLKTGTYCIEIVSDTGKFNKRFVKI
ncbi:MAG: T9SS type A sorting domain-containing protein [Burkholderiales bacterium]|nr:T9SS type A sorting domain-containing protein [Flavobacterium sp.]